MAERASYREYFTTERTKSTGESEQTVPLSVSLPSIPCVTGGSAQHQTDKQEATEQTEAGGEGFFHMLKSVSSAPSADKFELGMGASGFVRAEFPTLSPQGPQREDACF